MLHYSLPIADIVSYPVKIINYAKKHNDRNERLRSSDSMVRLF